MSDLAVEDSGGVRTITFNRPPAKNALTLNMRQEFCRVVDGADRDPSVRAIIITGTDAVLALHYQGRDLSFNAALAPEIAHVARGRPWDGAEFAARGREAPARHRPPGG